ncbi:MAG: hypothetical protein J6Q13_00130 [Clostridia bacterium]|nr:hypothetical protein [Clostridia bacterium]
MVIYNNNENSLHDCLKFVENFEIFNAGKSEKIDETDNRFNHICLKLENVFQESFLMPAFGVSLHQETLNEMEKGVWLQINFNQELTKSGLNFNSLLFKLESVQGFNLIRKFNNKYDGRCLYLNLMKEIDLNAIIEL